MENASTEVSLESHLSMVKEVVDHLSLVIFTKENMGAYKPVPVVNLPPVRFIGGPSRQGISGNIQGDWDPDISVALVTVMGVTLEEVLSDIGMNVRRSVIHLEFDCEEDW